MSKDKIDNPITWLQFNNIVPIITSAIIIAMSWAALTTRLSLIEQKVDFIANTLEKHYNEVKVRDENVNNLQKEVAIIKSILKY